MVDLAANALTTIERAELELGLVSGAQDDLLARLINVASDSIERSLGRKLYYEADIAESVGGFGTMFLMASRTPIVALDSITYSGDTIGSDNYEISNADAGLIYGVAPWRFTSPAVSGITRDPYPGGTRKLYVITYDGGWVTQPQVDDDGSLTRSLPWDIEDACLMLVATRYRSIGRDRSVASEKLLSWSASYRDSSVAPEVEAILDGYRGLVSA